MKNILVGLIGLIFTNVCMGGEQVNDRKLTQISTFGEYAIVFFTPIFEDAQNCSSTNKNRAAIRFDNDLKKEMFSTALSAAIVGKDVSLGVSGCDASGIPTAYRVDVKF